MSAHEFSLDLDALVLDCLPPIYALKCKRCGLMVSSHNISTEDEVAYKGKWMNKEDLPPCTSSGGDTKAQHTQGVHTHG